MNEKLPFVGTALIILNSKNQMLWGKRTYTPVGWSVAGGKIEFNETIEECAKREALEEIGTTVKNVKLATVGDEIFKEHNHHSITIFVFADIEDENAVKNMEPEKCDGWEWFDLDKLPTDLAFNYEPVLKNDCELIKNHIKSNNSN